MKASLDIAHAMRADTIYLSPTDDGRLMVDAQTREAHYRTTVAADFLGDGCALPIAALRAQVRAAESGVVIRSAERVTVRDSVGTTTYSQAGAISDLAPMAWQSGGVVVDRAELLKALRWVILAVGDPGWNAALGSVCIEAQDGELMMTATDGKRLHHAGIQADYVEAYLPRLVSLDAAKLWVRALAAGRAPGAVVVLSDRPQLTCGDAVIQSPAVSATFPDWRALDLSFCATIRTNRAHLIAVLRAILPTTNSQHHAVTLDTDGLSVSTRTRVSLIGMDVQTTGRHARQIGVSAVSLLDALKASTGDDVTISIGADPLAPVIITGESTTAIISPVRLD